MKRREFVAAVGGTVVTWSFAARAQQPARMRLIGVLVGNAESDPDAQFGSQCSEVRLRSWGGQKAAISGSNFAGARVTRIG